jgi:hypothetical protein
MIQMTILPMLDYADIIYRLTGKGALVLHLAIRIATYAPLRTHHCTPILLCKLVISVYTSQDPLVDAYL